ncbi:thiamine monophosphate synthase [Sphingomonas sp. Leaf24]|uniref:thiamine phosphate synthase n=1 Tax=unclassified Sphingomonas TaxID=196159 RepID=UPI000700E5FB|nr:MULTISPECIES: thiamine phosphate synthase [unclassified Sphingomonas]KQM23266.1 thiamine monophosphate synthase [Sphingomonas sp. Leaf5]KQM96125.1 thiamine monophosphate synthase [Sphingomonas sp. Leaf24]
MRRRHPLPSRWLMTDERLGDDLAAKVAKLPRGSGVVFRQYATPEGKRRRMFAQVRRIARARRLVLLVAGPFLPGGDGVHGRKARKNRGLTTRPVHSVRERIAAERAGVDATFVSPVFATRSHPGARPLGRVRFALLIRGARLPVIALGGMTEQRARTLPGIAGWAAIDAWSEFRA